MWVQVPSDTPYTHLVQWLEHQAYTLGVGGSNPSVSTALEFQSGLMAQSAKLMIREFKSHLQVCGKLSKILKNIKKPL